MADRSNGASSSTIRTRLLASYAQEVRKHIIPGLGRINLEKLGPAHLQSYYSSKRDSGLSARTVQYHTSSCTRLSRRR